MGLDKIDVRIRREMRFRAAFVEACRELSLRGIPTKYYCERRNLRRLGLQAILHRGCWFNGHSKLELVGVAERPFSTVLAEIGSVVDIDPEDLALMRVDFAVDVPGFPVAWFRRHTSIARKQHGAEHGTQYSKISSNRSETLYIGKRPNCFRIYDKLLELKVGARRQRKKELPPFAYCPGTILTRVERQCGGGRVPPEMGTLGDVKRNHAIFNPFTVLQFRSVSQPSLNPEECGGISEFLKRKGLYQLIEEEGLDEVRRTLNKVDSGNAARLFKRYLYPAEGEGEIPDLYGLYLKSLEKQFSV